MARLFGTDGARGVANTELTCQTAFLLGQAAVAQLGKTIVLGKDTRLSGDMLEASVVAGITSMGGTALLAGIIPTPAIALLVREMYCDAGIVISASHNPPEYNGIKFFNSEGFKLTDEAEDALEAFVSKGGASSEELPAGDEVGVTIPIEEAQELYIEHAVQTVLSQDIDFKGLKIALDTGHGASSLTSPEAFERLGAEVVAINIDFNGVDINVGCGSTHLEPLMELMKETKADIGVAHDGDADRVLFVSPDGSIIDGDTVLAVCAQDLKNRNDLPGSTVVTTIMCNLGFVHGMRDAEISTLQAKVGDRYVLEQMREGGYILGGEQSGHTIFLRYNSTGDGLVTACQFIAACRRMGIDFNQAAQAINHYPQTLINVRLASKEGIVEHSDLLEAVKIAEEELGEQGRVLIRPSGTEPVIRVMVESACEQQAQEIAQRLAAVVEKLGTK